MAAQFESLTMVLSRALSSFSKRQSAGAATLPWPARKTVPILAKSSCFGPSLTYAKVQYLSGSPEQTRTI